MIVVIEDPGFTFRPRLFFLMFITVCRQEYLEGVGVDGWMRWYLEGFLLEYESRPHCYPQTEVKI
jgi:hypothetical protein